MARNAEILLLPFSNNASKSIHSGKHERLSKFKKAISNAPTSYSFICLVLMGLLLPTGVYEIFPFVTVFWQLWSVAATLASVGLYCCLRFNFRYAYRLDKVILLFIGFFLLFICITIVNAGSIIDAIKVSYRAIAIVFLWACCRQQPGVLFNSLWIYLNALLVINFFCVIAFPSGMYSVAGGSFSTNNWFLGYKSSLSYYVLPALALAALLYVGIGRKGSKKAIPLFILFYIAETLISGAVTLSAVLIVSLALLLLSNKPSAKKIFQPWIFLAVLVVVNCLLLFNFITHVPLITDFIQNVLHKTITLSGRTQIWDIGWEQVSQSPILGHGKQSEEVMHVLLNSDILTHFHNQVLDVFFMGGFVLAAFFFLLVGHVFLSLKKEERYGIKVALLIGVFAILLNASLETLMHNYDVFQWLILLVACQSYYLNFSVETTKEASA